jgi:hypothetical protein
VSSNETKGKPKKKKKTVINQYTGARKREERREGKSKCFAPDEKKKEAEKSNHITFKTDCVVGYV